MPFATDTMARYAPLSKEELAFTLYDLKFKAKSSPMAQVADLYTYPLARGGYDPDYFPYAQLKGNQKRGGPTSWHSGLRWIRRCEG
jgi:hypothetical protein